MTATGLSRAWVPRLLLPRPIEAPLSLLRPEDTARLQAEDTARLLAAVQELAGVREENELADAVRRSARALTGADGVTLILKDHDRCYYAAEDAIGPLWAGKRFPMVSCVSGIVLRGEGPLVIPDIYADPRIPEDLYRPTFVKSLAIVPVRQVDPLGAIGAYWSTCHRATAREMSMLQALANATSTALTNVALLNEQARAIRARDEFLTIATHELKTPLTALRLQLQSLERAQANGADAHTQATKLARANAATKRLCTLVEQLLDATSVSSGGTSVTREATDLVQWVLEVTDRYRDTAELAECPLTVQVGETPLICHLDRSRIDQVLSNLIANALKYGARKPVHVQLRHVDDCAVLSVRDEGIGIKTEDHARIFGRYERAAPVNHYGGFGIGLYVAQQIVEGHGGTLSLDSRLGCGSTFTVALPLRAYLPTSPTQF